MGLPPKERSRLGVRTSPESRAAHATSGVSSVLAWRISQPFFLSALVALAFAGGILVFLGTRWGADVGWDDSFQYITSAENLAHGRGLGYSVPNGGVVRLTHYPPMLPLVLAPFEVIGFRAVLVMRWFNIVLFVFTMAMTGTLAYRLTRSRASCVVAALLVVLSSAFIKIHTQAMSDGLYLALSIAGLALLERYLRGRRTSFLILSALVIGAAFLTRYVGASLVLVGCLALLTDTRRRGAARAAAVAAFVFISTTPMLVWLGYTRAGTNRVAGRLIAWHPIEASFLRSTVDTLYTWFVPGRLVHGRELLFLLSFILVALLVVVLWLRSDANRRFRRLRQWAFEPGLAWMLVVYPFVYYFVFVLSKSLIDDSIFVDDRLLAPILQVLILALVVVLTRLWRTNRRIGPAFAVALFIAVAGLYLSRTYSTVGTLYREGSGYTSRGYHESPAIALAQRFAGHPIFTNAVPALYYWTGRVPYSIDPLAETKRRLQEECGILIVFDSIPLDLFNLTQDQVAVGLVVERTSIADIYSSPSCATQLAPWLNSL